jgi:hypothetical protein
MPETTILDQEHLQKQGEIVTDLVMRIAAVERLLIDKKVITEQELVATLEKLSSDLMELIKQRLEEQTGEKASS